MLTIERYFFNKKEIKSSIAASRNGETYSLTFVGDGDGATDLQLTVHGRKNFKALLKEIKFIGKLMLEGNDGK